MLVSYPEGFPRLLCKGYSVPAPSIKKHTCARLLPPPSVSKWFSEQGAGRRMDRACRHKGGWCHMLQDELRARRVPELSAQRPQGNTLRNSCNTLLTIPAAYLAFPWVQLSPCYVSGSCRETFSLSSGVWMSTGLKPSWERKLEFALCSSQRWVPPSSSLFLPSCVFLNAILQAPSRLTTRQFGPLLCNESDRRCSCLRSVSARSQPGHHRDTTLCFVLFFLGGRV